ncbi:hypothetical protein NC652_033523 [Populus alba x Populus x berolinensis]|nr:hypothetical protein NC652_033523 [Populus alba x Populus x berolinensis]
MAKRGGSAGKEWEISSRMIYLLVKRRARPT